MIYFLNNVCLQQEHTLTQTISFGQQAVSIISTGSFVI